MKVNMHEAKSTLSRLAELACQGEEVVICKAGKPYLRLEPYRERVQERKLGGPGRMHVPRPGRRAGRRSVHTRIAAKG